VLPVAQQLHRWQSADCVVSYFLPLRSSWTNKLITAKDHASVQLNVGHLDESGVYNGSFSTFALCGQLRSKVRCMHTTLRRGMLRVPIRRVREH
jgi:hypothetical protein